MALNYDDNEFRKVFEAFFKFNVKYIIIGGFAVNRHGFKRNTGDIDFYLKDSLENRRNLIDALAYLKYGHFEMLLTMQIVAGYCEIMLNNGIYADLMTDIKGLKQINFDTYYNEVIIDKQANFEISYLNINHLLQNKIATNSPKDIIDVMELKKL